MHSLFSNLAELPPALQDNLQWIIVGIITIVGLFMIGLRDTLRFSIKRIWAISGVCFAESVRRRVLWITPLAILGVIIISQLQRSVDVQDAIRQTIKYSLFATGLVVVISTIILACTNLPKEIENRVIFTIVTKPTSRLEVVLGKVVGFSRVSGTILLLMGVFTWTYVAIRSARMNSFIADRLAEPSLDQLEKAELEHYQQVGLMSARHFETPADMQIYARPPEDVGGKRWISGAGDEECLVPFNVDPSVMFPAGSESGIGLRGFYIYARIGWDPKSRPPTEDIPEGQPPFRLTKPNNRPPFQMGATVQSMAPIIPTAAVEIYDENMYLIISSNQIKSKDATSKQEQPAAEMKLSPDGSVAEVRAWIQPQEARSLYNRPRFYVRLAGSTQGVDYFIDPSPSKSPHPAIVVVPDSQGQGMAMDPVSSADGIPALIFRGKLAQQGQQLTGSEAENPQIAVFQFRGNQLPAVVDGKIPFELSAPVEGGGNDDESSQEAFTKVNLDIRDLASGKSTTVNGVIENRRTVFLSVPADAITTSKFDVLLRCRTNGHFLGIFADSLKLVVSRENFTINLVKSLFILWMMSVLVVTIAIFGSTFLSWPIAFVLTIIVLLGHWGVDLLGDTAVSGIGRQVATDLFTNSDASVVKVVSSSVEALNTALNTLAKFLPDISQFNATEAIQEGVAIPTQAVFDAAKVLLGFGLPLTVLAYVFLKNKEVAP